MDARKRTKWQTNRKKVISFCLEHPKSTSLPASPQSPRSVPRTNNFEIARSKQRNSQISTPMHRQSSPERGRAQTRGDHRTGGEEEEARRPADPEGDGRPEDLG